MYPLESQAEDALLEARARFSYSSGSGPIAVYRCEECGFFHLTSKGPMNHRLAKLLKEGKIDLQKEANRWLDKLDRR